MDRDCKRQKYMVVASEEVADELYVVVGLLLLSSYI